MLGAALPLMTVLIGNLTNVLGGISSPGAQGIESLSSVQEFHSKVSHQALILVFIGISVFVATYVGTVCWIITGERISRRIRMYILSLGLSHIVTIFVRYCVRISHISIVLEQEKSQIVSLTTSI